MTRTTGAPGGSAEVPVVRRRHDGRGRSLLLRPPVLLLYSSPSVDAPVSVRRRQGSRLAGPHLDFVVTCPRCTAPRSSSLFTSTSGRSPPGGLCFSALGCLLLRRRRPCQLPPAAITPPSSNLPSTTSLSHPNPCASIVAEPEPTFQLPPATETTRPKSPTESALCRKAMA